METLLIELTDNKAYKLLRNLEELNLIRVVKKNTKVSSLRKNTKALSKNKEMNLGDLLASVSLKKAYSGMNSKSAMDKARQNKGS